MRTSVAVRPQLRFLLLASFVVVAESLVLASPKFWLHPELFRSAVIFDLVVIPGALWWLLVVRRGLARPRSIATVAVLSIGLCAALFGRELRLLALPLEAALVWALAREIRSGSSLPARAIRTELSVLPFHFLLPRGWALASNAVHLYTVLWLIGDLRALVLRPIRVEDGKLLLRIGLRWEADIPLRQIAAVERSAPQGLKLGVLGSPNLALRLRAPAELHGPFGIRKTADVLLLQVDDPEGLERALRG